MADIKKDPSASLRKLYPYNKMSTRTIDDTVNAMSKAVEKMAPAASQDNAQGPHLSRSGKKILDPNEPCDPINEANALIHEMVKLRERMLFLEENTKSKNPDDFYPRDYIVTRRQKALEKEVKELVQSKVIARLFMSDRKIERNVKRKMNYYKRMQEAKAEDEEETNENVRQGERRFYEYCEKRNAYSSELYQLRKEWEPYKPLFKMCQDYADTMRIVCEDLWRKVGAFTELDRISYMAGGGCSVNGETPQMFMRRMLEQCNQLQAKIEEEDREFRNNYHPVD